MFEEILKKFRRKSEKISKKIWEIFLPGFTLSFYVINTKRPYEKKVLVSIGSNTYQYFFFHSGGFFNAIDCYIILKSVLLWNTWASQQYKYLKHGSR